MTFEHLKGACRTRGWDITGRKVSPFERIRRTSMLPSDDGRECCRSVDRLLLSGLSGVRTEGSRSVTTKERFSRA